MNRQKITTYEEAVRYLYDTPRFTTKNTLEDTRRFLEKLGNPDRKLQVIHVAGTNGKGSVCAYMRYILEKAGYHTAVFTSPHLVDIRERFLVKGNKISKEVFLEAFLEIYHRLEEEADTPNPYHPTFFEYLFLMAMLIFADEEIDYCILETGLGGRLDATNVIEQKKLCVITRIGLDHVEYLGNTTAQIAWEKAGILRENTPLVFADADRQATGVLQEEATKRGISATGVSKKDYAFLNFKNKSIDFSVHTEYYGNVTFVLHTMARYQMENAALAIRAIEVCDKGRTITKEHLQEGVSACFWQGRMEEVLPEVYVDGAHNEDGIRAFLESVSEDGIAKENRILLFSAVQDKDYPHMIQQITASGLFGRIAVTQLHTKRAASGEALRQLFGQYPKCQAYPGDGVKDALQSLLAAKKPSERIYVAGSLYLVGEIKELLENDKF